MGNQCEEAEEVEDEEAQVQEAYEAYAELEEEIGSQLEGGFRGICILCFVLLRCNRVSFIVCRVECQYEAKQSQSLSLSLSYNSIFCNDV